MRRMKPRALLATLVWASLVFPQSGRRPREIRLPTQPPAVTETTTKPIPPAEPPPVTAERNQEYRCTEDGSLARILETDSSRETVLSAKEVDKRAVIIAKPKPSYTREARRNGVQGFVTLKLLLSATGKITRLRVVKGLPAGLTENGMRAACKLEFKPALKDGQAVAQWLIAEYVFRLADSSIFTP
jgi:TonB family protein